MVSAGPLSFMGANAPEEQHHEPRAEEEAVPAALRSVSARGGRAHERRNWRVTRETFVHAATTGSGRKIYEAWSDVALQLGEWNGDASREPRTCA
jgi:hypothetical protein